MNIRRFLVVVLLYPGWQGAALAQSVDAGGIHACALDSAGQVLCWGADHSGQLGNGPALESSASPQVIDSSSDPGVRFSSVSAGNRHSCAIDAGGDAWCWGQDNWGQVGATDLAPSMAGHPLAARIYMTEIDAANERLVAITAGFEHTCALTDTGSAWCWGRDSFGQLGDDLALALKANPVRVALPGGVRLVSLSAGGSHTCGVDDLGGGWCWGANGQGQAGSAAAGLQSPLPMPVSPLPAGKKLALISAGFEHTCALDESGDAWCWGAAGNGDRLGIGFNLNNQQSPIAVTMPPDIAFASISAGFQHTCALDTAGALWCWGEDGLGELGNDAVREGQAQPVAVGPRLAKDTVESVSAGAGLTCAVHRYGRVECWGNGQYGQLGAGHFGVSETPQPVPDLQPSNLSAGADHTCAITLTGQVQCWGRDRYGQLGNGGDAVDSAIPLPVVFPNDETVAKRLSAGGSHTCAIDTNGAAWCWGYCETGQLGGGQFGAGCALQQPAAVDMSGLPAGREFVDIASAPLHTCALDSVGDVWCWGLSQVGQLGNGPSVFPHFHAVPVRALAPPNIKFKRLAVGSSFTCAIDAAVGALYCWGDNSFGQLGQGDTTARDVPTAIPSMGNRDFTAIDLGGFHGCAVQTVPMDPNFSDLWCWGRNTFGQLGIDSTTDALMPAFVGSVTGSGDNSTDGQIAMGANHSCATMSLLASASCWGFNGAGQLGNGTRTSSDTPSSTLVGAVRAIAAGSSHTCVIRANGSVVCFGDRSYGQLGDGVLGNVPLPQSVPDVLALSDGIFFDTFE